MIGAQMAAVLAALACARLFAPVATVHTTLAAVVASGRSIRWRTSPVTMGHLKDALMPWKQPAPQRHGSPSGRMRSISALSSCIRISRASSLVPLRLASRLTWSRIRASADSVTGGLVGPMSARTRSKWSAN
ncbi:hypothetical protein BC828DRAFT_391940 [Blastocladiella britannica]|nr:hypothetical protein BC828DRAFT_391940 [Blastocladiella britannica]